MKKFFIICVTALCIMTISGCQNRYSDKMRLAEDYLNSEMSMDCTVVDCDFQQYSYGITAGMFMYSFTCCGKDGVEFTVRYQSYADLTDETVTNLIIDKKE